MPRPESDGYDTMHVCGYCIENLWSMSFIAQGFEKRIVEKKKLANSCFCRGQLRLQGEIL